MTKKAIERERDLAITRVRALAELAIEALEQSRQATVEAALADGNLRSIIDGILDEARKPNPDITEIIALAEEAK